eukprot:TRINITY_DN7846_c0_g1_i1.p1 TRINITY_DN7846_c0_g1~~TRINITY_DN7846_c0_g1_i1.p1  ORF type:complete len:115 (-),score=28.56 TRINITY_DN7846_c0_g1_i1:12-356(-)
MKELSKLKIAHAQAVAFSRVWQKEGEQCIDRLKQRHPLSGSQLESVDYQLHLLMSTSSLTKTKSPSAVFNFELKTETPDLTMKDEHFLVEFSHDQLNEFFMSLERIQEQLDVLS